VNTGDQPHGSASPGGPAPTIVAGFESRTAFFPMRRPSLRLVWSRPAYSWITTTATPGPIRPELGRCARGVRRGRTTAAWPRGRPNPGRGRPGHRTVRRSGVAGNRWHAPRLLALAWPPSDPHRKSTNPLAWPRPSAPRLLDRVRGALRARHYSPRTEEAYVGWIRRYVLFHNKRHPDQMSEAEVSAFLTALAARNVSASTQNQALAAVLFLYKVVLGRSLGWVDDIARAKMPERLPVVLTRAEVRALLDRLELPVGLAARLLYGGGLPPVRGARAAC
jgi:hypothetical protein